MVPLQSEPGQRTGSDQTPDGRSRTQMPVRFLVQISLTP
jgi:hypothetical protein